MSPYNDFGMQQVNNIEEIFKEYFSKNIPDRIIELGTANGEFTKMIYRLRNEINSNFKLITFEISDNGFIRFPVNCLSVRCDILHNLLIIKELIIKNTLILCDNGNKIMEMRELIPFLKTDCVIMAHDFGEQDFWKWKEINTSDVQDLIDKYKLQSHFQELMLKGAWLSLRK